MPPNWCFRVTQIGFIAWILAGNILHDAERLLSGFDDLSIAATIETGTYVAQEGVTECDWLSQKLAERLHGLTDVLRVRRNLVHAHPVRPFALDHQTAECLFSRLLSALMIGCAPGEVLDGCFRTELGLNATNRFVLTLPQKLRDLDESELFGSGPGSIDVNDAAPLLGLGFSLRLVRSLARSFGGDLRFFHQALIMSFPAVSDGRSNYKNEERECAKTRLPTKLRLLCKIKTCAFSQSSAIGAQVVGEPVRACSSVG